MWLRGTDTQGIPLWSQFNRPPALLPNADQMGFAYSAAAAHSLTATITQNQHNSQHTGHIQGATLCYAAETLANFAALLCVPDGHTVVGQSLVTHYVKPAAGTISVTATMLHTGRRSSVWQVNHVNSDGVTVAHSVFTGSVSKMTPAGV